MNRKLPLMIALVGVSLSFDPPSAPAGVEPGFERRKLTDEYYAEGAGMGDFDGDGIRDVVAGPYWYRGPDYQPAGELYEPKPQNRNRYADNFFSFVYDFNRDGLDDVLVVGFPGTPANWYENPGKGAKGHWPKHEVFDWVSNESPAFTQLVGDEAPELVCTRQGVFGYATFDADHPEKAWSFHSVSGAVAAKRFGHGLGVGDVDGDGRLDILHKDGWFQQPADLEERWRPHNQVFTRRGGAQMFVFDVDGDGDNDVVSSLAAHDHGLAWFEQIREDGSITFHQHDILGSRPADNPYGIVFSELHAAEATDMNGDGLRDIVTGKTYWSHHTRTPSWHDGALVYWFELRRGEGGQVDWIPRLADLDSGLGRQVVVGDLNQDGRPDIVSANMKGTFVLLQKKEPAAMPAPVRWPSKIPAGVLPKGLDGGPLNTDFETGNLNDWTATGDAYAGQPAEGEIDPKRRFGEGKQAFPQGRFWIGGFERSESDKPAGTLTSAPFRITHPFAAYRIGGGYHYETRMELVDHGSGRILFQTHGRNSERMFPESVDLSGLQGRTVVIRLVDEHTGGFGHLNFDDFRFYSKEPRFPEAVSMTKIPVGGSIPWRAGDR